MAESHQQEISKLEELFAANPEGRIFTHLAEAYRRAGDLARAQEILEEGLARHSDYSSAHVVMGRVLMDRGESEAATQAFSRVLELDPHNLVALRALGDLHRLAGRSGEALRYYSELQALDPTNAEAEALIAELSATDAQAVPGNVVAEAAETAFEGAGEPVVDDATDPIDIIDLSLGLDDEELAAAGESEFEDQPTEQEAEETEETGADGRLRDLVAELQEDLAEAGDNTGGFALEPLFKGVPTSGQVSGGEPPQERLEGLEYVGKDVAEPEPFEELAELVADLGMEEDSPADEAEPDLPGAGELELAEQEAESEEAELAGLELELEQRWDEAMEEAPAEESAEPLEEELVGLEPELEPQWDAGLDEVLVEETAESLELFEEPVDLEQADLDPAAAEVVGEEPDLAAGGEADLAEEVVEAAAPDEMELAAEVVESAEWEPSSAELGFAERSEASVEGVSEEPAEADSELPDWLLSEVGEPVSSEPEPGVADRVAPLSEAREEGLVLTETMGDVYARQGLHQRAAEVYRELLLSGRAGDKRLEDKLEAVLRQAADPSLKSGTGWMVEDVESAWTGGQVPGGGEETPYTWADEVPAGLPPELDTGEVGDYLREILAWRPGGPELGESDPLPPAIFAEEQRSRAMPESAVPASEPVAPPSVFPEEQRSPAEPGQALPETEQGSSPAGAEVPDSAEDDDLEMFRAWLQSLKE